MVGSSRARGFSSAASFPGVDIKANAAPATSTRVKATTKTKAFLMYNSLISCPQHGPVPTVSRAGPLFDMDLVTYKDQTSFSA